MLKLKRKGVKTIILIFDKDAILDIKKYSKQAAEHFDNVLCGFVDNKDLNESTDDEIIELFDNLSDFKTFDNSFVNVTLYE
jgi:hypothetical protein